MSASPPLGDDSISHSCRATSLDLLRVIAIFVVVLAHSPISADLKARSAAFFVTDFIANGAVPAFFILSGYLSTRKIDDSRVSFGNFAKEKFRTLCIPFLFWNGLLLTAVVAARHFSPVPLERAGGGGYFAVGSDIESLICALFGIGRSPIVYQFWFLRDLILVSPLAFLICRHVPRVPFLPWLLFLIPWQTVSSLGFYLLGTRLSGHDPGEVKPAHGEMARYCAIWVLCGYGMLMGWVRVPFPLQQLGGAAFLGFLAVIAATTTIGKRFAGLAGATFFIYAVHQPLESIFAKLLGNQRWGDEAGLASFYLIPLFCFPACVLVYRLIRRYAPWVLPCMTGGR